MLAAGMALAARRYRWIRLASVVTGMTFVLYLVYAELIGVGPICPYCTSVRIITFLLFTLIVCQFVFHEGYSAGRVEVKGDDGWKSG